MFKVANALHAEMECRPTASCHFGWLNMMTSRVLSTVVVTFAIAAGCSNRSSEPVSQAPSAKSEKRQTKLPANRTVNAAPCIVSVFRSADGYYRLSVLNAEGGLLVVQRFAEYLGCLHFQKSVPGGHWESLKPFAQVEKDFRDPRDEDWVVIEGGHEASWSLDTNLMYYAGVGDKLKLAWTSVEPIPPYLQHLKGRLFPPIGTTNIELTVRDNPW